MYINVEWYNNIYLILYMLNNNLFITIMFLYLHCQIIYMGPCLRMMTYYNPEFKTISGIQNYIRKYVYIYQKIAVCYPVPWWSTLTFISLYTALAISILFQLVVYCYSHVAASLNLLCYSHVAASLNLYSIGNWQRHCLIRQSISYLSLPL